MVQGQGNKEDEEGCRRHALPLPSGKRENCEQGNFLQETETFGQHSMPLGFDSLPQILKQWCCKFI